MVKRCVYCNIGITDSRAVDICNGCGIRVWGEKMFNAIVDNMNNAESSGTLCNSNLNN
jgi:hypothetical protein